MAGVISQLPSSLFLGTVHLYAGSFARRFPISTAVSGCKTIGSVNGGTSRARPCDDEGRWLQKERSLLFLCWHLSRVIRRTCGRPRPERHNKSRAEGDVQVD